MTRRARTPRELIAPWAFGLLLFAGWWAVSAWSKVPAFLLPSPLTVASRFVTDLAGGQLWPYIWTTVAEAVLGALAGTAVALPLAVLIHRSRWTSAAVQPFLGATQAIPAIALAPLLVLWVGYGLAPIVTLCALMVFFPILISSVLGLRQVDRDLIAAARIDGAGSFDLLFEIEAPLALPAVLAGLRNGFTLSVTGAVVGEMVMGGQGVGTVLTVQRDSVDTAGMFASIAILCLIASAAYGLILAWERRSRIVDSVIGN